MDEADLLNDQAALLIEEDRPWEGEAKLREALALDPRNALYWYNLGIALEDQGKAGAALIAYRRSLAFDPQHADARFNLERLEEEEGLA